MSKLKAIQNTESIRCELVIDQPYSKCVVDFYDEHDNPIPAKGINHGAVQDMSILITNRIMRLNAEIDTTNTFYCVLNFFDDNGFKNSETLIPTIIKTEPEEGLYIRQIEVNERHVKAANEKLKHVLTHQTAGSWLLTVQKLIDIEISIINEGQGRILAIGPPSDVLSATDFVFGIGKNIKRIVIPSLFLRNKGLKNEDEIVVSELVKSNCHTMPNLLFKKQISNKIRLGEQKQNEQSELMHVQYVSDIPIFTS